MKTALVWLYCLGASACLPVKMLRQAQIKNMHKACIHMSILFLNAWIFVRLQHILASMHLPRLARLVQNDNLMEYLSLLKVAALSLDMPAAERGM